MHPASSAPCRSRYLSQWGHFGLAVLVLAVLALQGLAPVAAAQMASAGVVVEGFIYDSLGQPLGLVEVVVEAQDGSFQSRLTASHNGRFNVRLPAAAMSYDFRLELSGYSTLERTLQLSELGLLPGGTPQRQRVNFTIQAQSDLDRALRPGLREWPQEAWDLYFEGLDAIDEKRTDDAIATFELALAEDPRFPPANAALAVLYLESHRYAEAAAAADSYLRYSDRFTQNPVVVQENQRVLADALFALGDCERGLEVAEQVLEFAPSDTNSLRGTYLCLREQGDEGAAEAVLQRLAEVDSLGLAAILVHNRGVERFARDEFVAAADDFAAARRLDPRLIPARMGVAKARAMANDHAEALAAVADWLAVEPESAEALTLQYDALSALERFEEAEAVVLRLSEIRLRAGGVDAELAKRVYLVGERAFHAGQFERAANLFERALRHEPGQLLAQRAVILARYQAGQPAAALEAARRLLQQVPDDEQALRLAAKAERALATSARPAFRDADR